MKSVTQFYLDKTEEAVWHRGEDYVNKGRVRVEYYDDRKIEAVVSGKESYKVTIRWVTNGLRKSCTCPYKRGICKHVVATAIVWDELFGIARPSKDMVRFRTIQPPPISRQQITACYNDPLNADLDVIRIAVDYYALSPKAHARLPRCPRIETHEKVPLTFEEVKKALNEMEKWSRRREYHSYFCAGEMAAAFSEMLEIMEKRLPSSPSEVMIKVMAHCVDWFYREFEQMIDSSDGVWIFPLTRIGKIVARLLDIYPSHSAWQEFNQVVEKVGDWWGEPALNAEVIAGWRDQCL